MQVIMIYFRFKFKIKTVTENLDLKERLSDLDLNCCCQTRY